MNPGTDYVTPAKRISENDYRSTRHLSENFVGEGMSSPGWTWLAALLVSALFIVSGYLDQESGIMEPASSSVLPERHASNISAPQVMVTGANKADGESAKGY